MRRTQKQGSETRSRRDLKLLKLWKLGEDMALLLQTPPPFWKRVLEVCEDTATLAQIQVSPSVNLERMLYVIV